MKTFVQTERGKTDSEGGFTELYALLSDRANTVLYILACVIVLIYWKRHNLISRKINMPIQAACRALEYDFSENHQYWHLVLVQK